MGEQGLPKAKVNVGFVRKGKQKKQAGENQKGNFGKSQDAYRQYGNMKMKFKFSFFSNSVF